jgi:hypothetical protein
MLKRNLPVAERQSGAVCPLPMSVSVAHTSPHRFIGLRVVHGITSLPSGKAFYPEQGI